MISHIHRAQYAYRHPDILENAAVVVKEDGHILAIDTWNHARSHAAAQVLDWGAAILLPGLVNAHTHLELTYLHNQVMSFSSFTGWILQLMRQRRSWTAETYQASAEKGAQLSLAAGTTLIGDITSRGAGWTACSAAGARRAVFEEVLSLYPDRAEPVLASLTELLHQAEARPRQIHGISPHAPYSTGPELYRQAAALARREKRLLTTHLAETRAEEEFLLTANGEFRDFLLKIGALPDAWQPPGISPVAYLDSLNVLGPHTVLVHCNYLDDAAISRIAQSGSSVVYCPRSHSFFGHEHHPIRQLMDAGVHVALGTDSLASNHSLSILDEMRHLYGRHPDVAPDEIFQAATAHGARALGFSGRLGCLDPGYLADMTVLKLPETMNSRQLLHQILEGAGHCSATILEGVVAWKQSGAETDPVLVF